MGYYVVKSGDTGDEIAKAAKPPITTQQLMAANPGINWANLTAGQHLHIPNYEKIDYSVVSGDTGYGIAGRYGITFATLEEMNNGINWQKLKPGDTLKVPKTDGFLLKDCIGAPVLGVPAQMQPPDKTTAYSMSAEVKARVKNLIGGDIPDGLIAKVNGLDWVGCFKIILNNQKNMTMDPNKWPEADKDSNFKWGAPKLAIVDLRNPNNSKQTTQVLRISAFSLTSPAEWDTDSVPWKIPGAKMLPCIEGKSNKDAFDRAMCDQRFASICAKDQVGQLNNVIFVDTHGHSRAPEMATRYAQWILKERKEAGPENIFFLIGGLAAYCNAQSFGRVLLHTPNAFSKPPSSN